MSGREEDLFCNILGGVFTAIGGMCFWSAHSKHSEAKYYASLPYTKLADVYSTLQRTGSSSTVMKIAGIVGCDEPGHAELDPFVETPVYRHTKSGRWASWNRESGNEYIIASRTWVKDFYIHDTPEQQHHQQEQQQQHHQQQQQHRVYVKPWDLQLEQGKVQVEPAGNFLLSLLFGYFHVPYPYQYVEREYHLPLKSSLLCIGKVYEDPGTGQLHIKRPNSGFFGSDYGVVSRMSEEELLDSLYSSMRWRVGFGTFFTLSGASMILFNCGLSN